MGLVWHKWPGQQWWNVEAPCGTIRREEGRRRTGMKRRKTGIKRRRTGITMRRIGMMMRRRRMKMSGAERGGWEWGIDG